MACVINKGGFFAIAFVRRRRTHLPRFEALAYVLPHYDALNHVVIRVLNLRKAHIFKSLLKVYYRSVFNESSKAFIFQKCAESLHPE